MNESKSYDQVIKALQTPPVNFAEAYEHGDIESQDEIDMLERAAIHLAMFAAYMEGRFTLQTGHTNSAKKANRVRKALRKAFGYTLPGSDIYF